MSVKEATITLEGTPGCPEATIDYVAFGKGQRTLLIIPGLTLRDVKGSGYGLAAMYRCFSKDFRVYCIDKRNEGYQGCSIESLAEDYASALQQLGLEQACVMGVSQGGMIAQYLAVNHPELVSKLVLAVTSSQSNETTQGFISKVLEQAEAGDFKELALTYFEDTYSESYKKKYRLLLPALAGMSKPGNPERFISLAKACLTCDIHHQLPEIQCPVLVIGGEQDKVVSAEASREIAQQLGDSCSLYMYPEYGHSAYEEAKDFNQRVLDFFLD